MPIFVTFVPTLDQRLGAAEKTFISREVEHVGANVLGAEYAYV